MAAVSAQAKTAPRSGDSLIDRWIHRAGFADEGEFVLRVVQPALVGMIDGTVSSLAPIFAAAIVFELWNGVACRLGDRPRGRCQHGLV